MNSAIILPTASKPTLSREIIISQVIKNLPFAIDFNQVELEQLYQISVEYRNNSIDRDMVIVKISDLRGGGFIEVMAGLIVIGSMILVAGGILAEGFVPNPNVLSTSWTSWKSL